MRQLLIMLLVFALTIPIKGLQAARLNVDNDDTLLSTAAEVSKGSQSQDASYMIGISATASQQIPISGVVTDALTGEKLPGVNVMQIGTTTGTITDINGEYSLTVVGPESVLKFSYIGYLTENITVGDLRTINISLVQDIATLDAVVVVGYGTVKKEDLTGSVSVVNMRDLERFKAPSVTEALAARSPGVSVSQSSGSAGRLPTIRIRGIGTITNAEPLYVVDGLPMDPSNITYLNNDDIESISILKDASAQAIYGARAANGVVIITTKRGQRGVMQVNYSSYAGQQRIVGFPSMMSGHDWVDIQNNVINASNPSLHRDPSLIVDTDWLSTITRPAMQHGHNLSFSGGTENLVYRFSGSYLGQEGVLNRTHNDRLTLRLSTDATLRSWLKVGQSITFVHMDYRGVSENFEYGGRYFPALMGLRVISPYDEDGNWSVNPYTDQYVNPVRSIEDDYWFRKTYKGVGNVFGEVEFIRNLKFRSSIGYDLDFNEGDAFTPRIHEPADYQRVRSSLEKSFGRSYRYTFENILSYEHDIDQHNLKFMVGHSLNEAKGYGYYMRHGNGISSENPALQYFGFWNDMAQPTYRLNDEGAVVNVDQYLAVTGGTPGISRFMGYLGRAEYNYAGRYLFTFNIRRDGSDRFGPQNRFGIFPGVAAAWRISDENFMQNFDAISMLKFRAGWGKIGNDRIRHNAWRDLINVEMAYVFDGIMVPAGTALTPANPYLHWESKVTTNFGIDINFFENRIESTLDLYHSHTADMLTQPEPVSTTGIAASRAPAQNIADLENMGYEFSLNYRNQMNSSFSYNVGGHISGYRNRVLNLGLDGKALEDGNFGAGTIRGYSVTQEGYPIGMFYGHKVVGIFQDWEEVNSHAAQNRNTRPGDLKFADLNNDGTINDADRTFIGNPHPLFSYGFTFGVNYFGFDLSGSIRGDYKKDILVAYKTWSHAFVNGGRNYHIDLLNPWSPENPDSKIPAFNAGIGRDNNRMSDALIEDGSFLRMQFLQLGWTLPKNWTASTGLSNIRLYVSAQNLFTISGYEYGNPDIGQAVRFYDDGRTGSSLPIQLGVDYGNVPVPRTFLGGIEVAF